MELVPVTRSGLGVQISGQGIEVSGQLVSIQSGTFVITQSGQYVQISGQGVTIQSGTYVNIGSGVGVLVSGQTVQLQSGTTVLIQETSGVTLRLSGVFVQISGQGVLISGQTVAVASGTIIVVQSGLGIVGISGQAVVAFISGEVTYFAPSSILAGYSQITDASGGVILASGVVVSVEIRNLPGNDNMWIGPPGVVSGGGWLLQGGEVKDIDIGSLGAVYLIAATSGQYVSYLGLVV